MKGSPNIARVGALIGEPARASMLNALMSGQALTATELAREAGITPQTASSHLSKLEQGGLLQLRKQGRHKYFSLATEEVASVLETLMGLEAGNQSLRYHVGPTDSALRHSRVCYNHLAGDRGIQLYDSLIAKGYLMHVDHSLVLTSTGEQFVESFGINLSVLRQGRSVLCRECLDWSERRSHLAGSLGRALYTRFEALQWVNRVESSRVVTFTPEGKASFERLFG